MRSGQRVHPRLPVAFLLVLVACGAPPALTTPSATVTSIPASMTPTPTAVPPTHTPAIVPSATPTPEPDGCLQPPDDYTRIEIDYQALNQRTLAMLMHAQEMYGGEIELAGYALTQGSYTDRVAASFGTHAGGGAVDLSVMRAGTYTVLWDDVPRLLQALRVAGFAAWLRDYGELYPDSPIHIHAIAIGDHELSAAAIQQLTGPAGYFHGYSGLPFEEGNLPTPDRFGGPILCQWMIDLGYRDLR